MKFIPTRFWGARREVNSIQFMQLTEFKLSLRRISNVGSKSELHWDFRFFFCNVVLHSGISSFLRLERSTREINASSDKPLVEQNSRHKRSSLMETWRSKSFYDFVVIWREEIKRRRSIVQNEMAYVDKRQLSVCVRLSKGHLHSVGKKEKAEEKWLESYNEVVRKNQRVPHECANQADCTRGGRKESKTR